MSSWKQDDYASVTKRMNYNARVERQADALAKTLALHGSGKDLDRANRDRLLALRERIDFALAKR